MRELGTLEVISVNGSSYESQLQTVNLLCGAAVFTAIHFVLPRMAITRRAMNFGALPPAAQAATTAMVVVTGVAQYACVLLAIGGSTWLTKRVVSLYNGAVG